jgi:hypothetical protein
MLRKAAPMKAIRGRYNGSVVVLEEPAPVNHEVSVIVEFPEPEKSRSAAQPRMFHWAQARSTQDDYSGSVTDELIRQRRME